MSEQTLVAFGMNCIYLRVATFRGCIGLSYDDVLRFIGSCPNLRKLEVSGCWNMEEGETLVRRVSVMYPRLTFGLAV